MRVGVGDGGAERDPGVVPGARRGLADGEAGEGPWLLLGGVVVAVAGVLAWGEGCGLCGEGCCAEERGGEELHRVFFHDEAIPTYLPIYIGIGTIPIDSCPTYRTTSLGIDTYTEPCAPLFFFPLSLYNCKKLNTHPYTPAKNY